MTTSLEQLRRDFAVKYAKPRQEPQPQPAPAAPVAAEIKKPAEATIRAQFDAADPDMQQFIRDCHAEGLIDGLRDVTFFDSIEAADAAREPGFIGTNELMMPTKK